MPYMEETAGEGAGTIHILHADPLLRAGLYALLGLGGEWRVSFDDRAWQMPAVLLADYATGVALARAGAQGAPILVVTPLEREEEIMRALDAGVQGYVPQSCRTEELRHAVRQLLAGRSYVGEALRDRLAAASGRIALTSRETDVLRLLAEGNCNKVIARQLGIGVGTVKTHVKSVMAKLGATARTHAVVLAAQRGLVTPGHRQRNHGEVTIGRLVA